MNAFDLSIIIPVGPGDEAWRGLLPLLSGLPSETQIVLSACREAPLDWPEILEQRTGSSRCHWLHSAQGRANQFNAGIEHSGGHWLWLLHADSRPDQHNVQAVMHGLRSDQERWYYFDLAFEQDRPWLTQLNATGANLRSRLARLPFGDQGWLLPRKWFNTVGIFDTSWPKGEDLEWVLRARHHGMRPTPIGQRLVTSARRYAEHGWLRTTIDHQIKTVQMIRAALKQHRRQDCRKNRPTNRPKNRNGQ